MSRRWIVFFAIGAIASLVALFASGMAEAAPGSPSGYLRLVILIQAALSWGVAKLLSRSSKDFLILIGLAYAGMSFALGVVLINR